MKQVLALLAAATCFGACGDNNVGNRTYDLNTKVDSAEYPVGNSHDDTTATINNNAYNPDSMPENGTLENIGSGSATQNNEIEKQQRNNAGPNIPRADTQQRKKQQQ